MESNKRSDDLYEMLKSDTAKSAVSAFNQGYKLGYELGFNQGQLLRGEHE